MYIYVCVCMLFTVGSALNITSKDDVERTIIIVSSGSVVSSAVVVVTVVVVTSASAWLLFAPYFPIPSLSLSSFLLFSLLIRTRHTSHASWWPLWQSTSCSVTAAILDVLLSSSSSSGKRPTRALRRRCNAKRVPV